MNMNNLMAQAQKMQKDIQKKQDEINSMTFVGESEWVEVTFNGKKELSFTIFSVPVVNLNFQILLQFQL